MDHFTFTLRFLVPGSDRDELATLIYESIDDASLMGPDRDGSFLLEFDRISTSLTAALPPAITELQEVVPDLQILGVEDDDLATMSAIAKRAGRTPESVRLLVIGRRGPGGFPPAAGRLDARTKAWRWADVARWFAETLGQPLPDTEDSAFLRAVNDALELRRLEGSLSRSQRSAVASIAPAGW